MSKAEDFVSLVLLDRDLAHLAHWKTKSYAEHKALNEFYDSVLELIDGFVEQYQGYYGGRMNIERADKLVQLIARQKGLSHPVIDAHVALVDRRLEANRKKAAAA